jgi:hypothetical protein
MKIKIALCALFLATPALAQQAPVCGYGQACPPGGVQVPFPVVNPFQGLNVLNQQLRQQQPPPSPTGYQAPVATPPPVLPPGYQR